MSAQMAATAHEVFSGVGARLPVLRIKDVSDATMGASVLNEPIRAVEVRVANLGHAMSS